MKFTFALRLGVAAMSLAAFAQQNPIMPPIRMPYPQLTRYLELTAEQQTGLFRLQAEWHRYLIEKQRRVGEVERELAQETNAKVPDPVALGVRYAELEAICREARDRDSQTMQNARKLLTAPQLTKLQTLEAAYALLPVIAEADSAGLMRAPVMGRVLTNATAVDVAQLIGTISTSYPGCRYPARLND
ncbi:MAG: hypothetical protein HXY18_06270 [Bryobacteraceae bacterium]|nr:hypothetical protein [Bryobacteraceae bacterium]